jgi:hypothetical protein
MRRNPIPPLIFVVTLIGLAGAYAFFQRALVPRYAATRSVLASRSDIELRMSVRYARGPLVEEDYTMSDEDGVSSAAYRGVGRSGLQITIAEPPLKTIDEGRNVANLFGEVVQDGIWELPSKPPRGNTNARYTLSIYQLTGTSHGSYRLTFTDPHYWATTGGHQFHLKLDKNKPLPDLLNLSSTVLVEPRYERLVADFRSFGPPSFRTKVAAAQSHLGARSQG